jgi:hypothetical protein
LRFRVHQSEGGSPACSIACLSAGVNVSMSEFPSFSNLARPLLFAANPASWGHPWLRVQTARPEMPAP